jgi:hypothetical protein
MLCYGYGYGMLWVWYGMVWLWHNNIYNSFIDVV